MNGGQCALAIAADHPAFAGHFPGQPIVPGVVLLDQAVLALDAALGGTPRAWRLGSAKFVRAVGPGAALQLRWQPPAANGAIAFAIDCDGAAVASGTLTPAA